MANLQTERDCNFMAYALVEARAALTAGEFPVGCVIVLRGEIIASARNSRQGSQSKIAHAELNAIRTVESLLYQNRGECEIFVTIEPCMMCIGAIICARLKRVVFGARDYRAGATRLSTFNQHYLKFAPQIKGGILADKSLTLLEQYVPDNKSADWVRPYFQLTSLV